MKEETIASQVKEKTIFGVIKEALGVTFGGMHSFLVAMRSLMNKKNTSSNCKGLFYYVGYLGQTIPPYYTNYTSLGTLGTYLLRRATR